MIFLAHQTCMVVHLAAHKALGDLVTTRFFDLEVTVLPHTLFWPNLLPVTIFGFENSNRYNSSNVLGSVVYQYIRVRTGLKST